MWIRTLVGTRLELTCTTQVGHSATLGLHSTLFFLILIFISLVVLGLRCSTQDLPSLLSHVESLVVASELSAALSQV